MWQQYIDFSIEANFVGKFNPTKSLQLKAVFPPSVDSSKLTSLFDFKWTCTSFNVELTFKPTPADNLNDIDASALLTTSPLGPNLVFVSGGLLPRYLPTYTHLHL